ncbi:MAG: VCBS repeat-containing protein [Bacteroidota bacterium]
MKQKLLKTRSFLLSVSIIPLPQVIQPNRRFVFLLLLLICSVFSNHHLIAQSFKKDSLLTLTPLYGGQSGWADFDNDGDLDLLTMGVGTDSLAHTYLYINQDSSKFLKKTTAIIALQHTSLSLADFNNDMYMDVLLTGTNLLGKPMTKLYANQAGATFKEMPDSLPALLKGKVLLADLNSDGKKDIFINV